MSDSSKDVTATEAIDRMTRAIEEQTEIDRQRTAIEAQQLEEQKQHRIELERRNALYSHLSHTLSTIEGQLLFTVIPTVSQILKQEQINYEIMHLLCDMIANPDKKDEHLKNLKGLLQINLTNGGTNITSDRDTNIKGDSIKME